MVFVKQLRGRGAHGVVEIHGEVLFAPGADIPRWQARFQERIYAAAVRAAPTHNYGKRPLRPHPGKPLKASFMKSRPRKRITKGGGFIYAAVGNSANYSAYVDQGTGVFVGNNPWRAKVLPPYSEGSPSLYESTWIPTPGGRRVAPVFIRGQKGKFFMDEALLRAFQSMKMRSYQVPGEGVSGLVANTLRTAVPAFPGNTDLTDGAGSAAPRLEEWRKWRDEAWGQRERTLGEGSIRRRTLEKHYQRRIDVALDKIARKEASAIRRREANRKYQQRRRDSLRQKETNTGQKRYEERVQQRLTRMRSDYLQWWDQRHRGFKREPFEAWGFWYTDRGGTRQRFFWPMQIADLYAELGVQHSGKDAQRSRI